MALRDQEGLKWLTSQEQRTTRPTCSPLRVHAESLGWVTDRASASEWLCHNADGYWSFNAGSNQWQLAGNTGFDDGLAWNAQPGNSVQNNPYSSKEATIAQLSAGPFTRYHLFATAAYLHLHRNRGRSVPAGDDWLAQQTGRRLYGRPVCLRLVPLQLWPGAHKQLVIASIRWLPHSIQRRRQHAAARQPRRWPIAGVVAVRLHNERRPARRRPRSRKLQQSVPSRCGLIDASANELNSSTTPVPCAIYAFGAQQRSRYVGEVPDFGICNMAFLAPGDPLVVGSDTWRVYPLLQRGTATDFGSTSAWVGYCFRVVGDGDLSGVPSAEAGGGDRCRHHAEYRRPGAEPGHQPGSGRGLDLGRRLRGASAGRGDPFVVPGCPPKRPGRELLQPLVADSDHNGAGQRRQHPSTTGISLERIFQSAHADRHRAEDADGITLSGQASPPLGFAALEERTWTVSIGTDGPPVVNARIIWKLQGEPDLVLVITGNRIIAWTFAPDWGDSIVERLSASTNILQSESAVTQRRAMRLAPRREFEANMYAVDRERQLLDMTLFGWGARIWALPIWPDVQLLQEPLAAGSLNIPCGPASTPRRRPGDAARRGRFT
ncbi:hypothetical protein K5A80_36450 [Pseudomonas aeruginosa]|nr:hypothetical protein [Pseudomonas aeruginosa]UIO45582.1 hypothetical protein K5A80_36450 [Pseudomonas aeruginosa]